MNKQILDKYIKRDITCFNVKCFIKELFKDKKCYKLGEVQVCVISLPLLSNGYTNVFKWKKISYIMICINIYPYLQDEKLTNKMKWFYIYVTAFHELCHINLFMKYNTEWNYCTYIAMLEEINDIRTSIFPKTIQWLIPGNKTKNKIYSTSSVELLCKYRSIKSAYNIFSSLLVDEEKKLILMILKASKFLIDYIEIGYSRAGAPYNKFNRSVVQAQRLIKKGYELLNDYPQLCYIYTPDGKIKSIEKIFEERTDENSDFIDCIIFQMFINFELDYSLILENNTDLKKHIELLANQYCEKCIFYIENVEVGSVLLKQEILDDNTLLLLKNVRYINKLMDKYHMVHTGGSLFLVEL